MNFAVEEREREAFIAALPALIRPGGVLPGFFDARREFAVARAPGRLDVMGGIADYSGSRVLELPLAEAACAAAQLHPEPELRVASVHAEDLGSVREARWPIAPFLAADYERASALLAGDAASSWARYVAGLVVPLLGELSFPLSGGLRVLLVSRVPEGKGISSSAAIAVAGFFALTKAAGLTIDPREAGLLCQRVENRVVGAPCGVMDPLTSACGRSGELLEILCQPATLIGSRSVPARVGFFGIDSGVRHAVTGVDYTQVRTAAFMGYRMIAAAAGLSVSTHSSGRVDVSDPKFHGFLANVTPSEFTRSFEARLPERLSGAEFLRMYVGTTDPLTRVEPDRVYPVRAATAHPIWEHHRVRIFGELLGRPATDERLELLGELMYASHESYSACGLGSEATDRIVAMVRAAGAERGLFGAKITGGGSGGTVAVLARADAATVVQELAQRYAHESGCRARVFAGSSAGAGQFGAVTLPSSLLAPRS